MKEREKMLEIQEIKAGILEEGGTYRGGVGGGEEGEEERVSMRRRSVGMSASTPSTLLATICVVDSSLAVAIEWGKIFSDYLAPIIQRLAELTSNASQVMSRRELSATPLTLSSSGSVSSHMASHPLAPLLFSASVSSSHLF